MQPASESKTPRDSKKAKPPEAESLDIDYSEVPFYRRRWFFLITVLLFIPVSALIALTGSLYYQQKGEVKKFPTSARVVWVIFGGLSTVLAVLQGVAMIGGLGAQGHACADDSTTGLVKEIFLKDVVNSMGMPGTSLSAEASAEVMKTLKNLDLKVTGVRTNGTQKSKKKFSCIASLDLALPAAAVEVANDPRIKQLGLAGGLNFEGNVITQQVQYTSQLADNGTEFFVELSGYETLQQVIALIGLDAFKSTAKLTMTPQPNANVSSVPTPAVEQNIPPAPAPNSSLASEVKSAQPIVESKSEVNGGQSERDSPPIVANLCTSSETILFACSTGKKLISVCGTPNLSANSGQIFYRLAPIGKAPEMTYPDDSQLAKTAFKQGSFRITNDRSGAFLSFSRGDYRYVLYSGEGNVQSYNGVAVERAGKRVANLKCEGDVNDSLDMAALSKIGVSTDAIIFEGQ